MVQAWYKTAYDYQYKTKEYEKAYFIYSAIVKMFPASAEAGYSLSQLSNMQSQNRLSQDVIAALQKETGDLYEEESMIADSNEKTVNFLETISDAMRLDVGNRVIGKSEDIVFVVTKFDGPSIKKIWESNEKAEAIKKIILAAKQDPILTLSVDNIEYFKEIGALTYTQQITGGGGKSKDVNVAGAVVGGLLSGGIGALIGSRVGTGIEIDPIKTITLPQDDRQVVLRYKERSDIRDYVFEYDCFDAFNKLIPEKEYNYIALDTTNEPQASTASEIPVQALRDLKMLLDEGIITQSDFEAKKKQLLGI